jgi:hypothetical protein
VEVGRSAGGLALLYLVSGEIETILLPPAAPPQRVDGLWQHSCFEAFLRSGDASGYREFNFSTSTAWAAFEFSGYREGMAPAEITAPPVKVFIGPRTIALSCRLDLDTLACGSGPLRLNLSAVLEEKSGTKSYWALAHPPDGPPDFHDPRCFVLELPPE